MVSKSSGPELRCAPQRGPTRICVGAGQRWQMACAHGDLHPMSCRHGSWHEPTVNHMSHLNQPGESPEPANWLTVAQPLAQLPSTGIGVRPPTEPAPFPSLVWPLIWLG